MLGARIVLKALAEQGVEVVFGYPGGAVLPIYDALFQQSNRLKHVLVRHEQGAVQEVSALVARGLSPDLPVMRAIGVREIAGWLAGVWGREEAIARGQTATWQYVRRQYTWFRRQPPADWLRIADESYLSDNSIETLFSRLLLT
jgi:tRNA dimethylallyltransferase